MKMQKPMAILTALLLSVTCLTACMSSNPCENCGNTPTQAYKNSATGNQEYYCQTCAADCIFCSGKATHHYSSGIGKIVFVCDDCYDYVKEVNKK